VRVQSTKCACYRTSPCIRTAACSMCKECHILRLGRLPNETKSVVAEREVSTQVMPRSVTGHDPEPVPIATML
jgi:hypothetical protein